MAIAIQSQNSTAFTVATSINITKPTGLAVGDLLLALIFAEGNDIATPTGWTSAASANTNSPGGGQVRALWKVADSGDVAASNFTFTRGSSAGPGMAGILFRITGHGPNTPISAFDAATSFNDNNGATITVGLNVTPTAANSLVIAAIGGFNTTIGASGYGITVDNPTWTEQLDINGSTSNQMAAYVATATRAGIAEIGDFFFDQIDTTVDYGMVFLCLSPQQDNTETPSPLAVRASVVAPAITGTSNVAPDPLAVRASVVAPTVTTADPDWVNEDATAMASYTNEPKT